MPAVKAPETKTGVRCGCGGAQIVENFYDGGKYVAYDLVCVQNRFHIERVRRQKKRFQ